MTAQFSKLLKRFRKQSLLDRVVVSAFVIASVIYGGTKSTNGVPPRMNAPRRMAQSTEDQTAGFNEEDLRRGFVFTGIGTNEVFDFSAPEGADVCEDWQKFGAAEDWIYHTLNDWKIPRGTNEFGKLRIFSNGKIEALPRLYDCRWMPLEAEMGIVPAARWGELANRPSRFWMAETDYGSVLFTWQNVLLNRLPETPVSFQAEFFNRGKFVYRYDLSRVGADVVSNVVCGATFGADAAWVTNSLATNVTSVSFYSLLQEDYENPDRDGDGVSTADEVLVYRTDPDCVDTDCDGLSDGEEIIRATDPLVADTDGDGLVDGSDPEPLVVTSFADADGDGIADAYENYWFGDTNVCNTVTNRDETGFMLCDKIAGGMNPTGGVSPMNVAVTNALVSWKICDSFTAQRTAGITNLVYERTFAINRSNAWQQFFISSHETQAGGWKLEGMMLEWETNGGESGTVSASRFGGSFRIPFTPDTQAGTLTLRLRAAGDGGLVRCNQPLYLIAYAPVFRMEGGMEIVGKSGANFTVFFSGSDSEMRLVIDSSHRPSHALQGEDESDLSVFADLPMSDARCDYEGDASGGRITAYRPGVYSLPEIGLDVKAAPMRKAMSSGRGGGGIIVLDPLILFICDSHGCAPGWETEYDWDRDWYYDRDTYPLDSKCLRGMWYRSPATGWLCIPELEVFSGVAHDCPEVSTFADGNTGYIYVDGVEVWKGAVEHIYHTGSCGGDEVPDSIADECGNCSDGCINGNCDDHEGPQLGSLKFRIPLGSPAKGFIGGFLWFETEMPLAINRSIFRICEHPEFKITETYESGMRRVVCRDNRGRDVRVQNITHGVRITILETASQKLEHTWEITNVNGDASRIRLRKISRQNNVMSDETFMYSGGDWTQFDNIAGIGTELITEGDLSYPSCSEKTEMRITRDANGNELSTVITTQSRIGEFDNAVIRETYREESSGANVTYTFADYWNDPPNAKRHGRMRLLYGNSRAWEYFDYDNRGRVTLRITRRNATADIPNDFPFVVSNVLYNAELIKDSFVTVYDYETIDGDSCHVDDSESPRTETKYLVTNGVATVIGHKQHRYTRIARDGYDAIKHETWRDSMQDNQAKAYSYEITFANTGDDTPFLMRDAVSETLSEEGELIVNTYSQSNGNLVCTIRKFFNDSSAKTYDTTVSDATYGNLLQTTTRLTANDAIINDEHSTYDEKNRLRGRTFFDGTSLTNSYSCCRLLWSQDREGRKKLRSAVTGYDHLYYADEDVWLGDVSTNNRYRITHHFFDALGRETNTVTTIGVTPGEAVPANANAVPSIDAAQTLTSETTLYPYGGSDYSERTDARGKVTISARHNYVDYVSSSESVRTNGEEVIWNNNDAYFNGANENYRTWHRNCGSAIEDQHRFDEYRDDGCRVAYVVTYSSDYAMVTNSVSVYDLLGRCISTSTPGANGAWIVTSNVYDGATSRLIESITTGEPAKTYHYNNLGERIGVTQNEITQISETTYEMISNEAWKVKCDVRISAGVTNSCRVMRTQLSGLSNNIRSHTVTTDANGSVTDVTTSFDEETGILTMISKTDDAMPVVTKTKYGLKVEEQNVAERVASSFDPLGRETTRITYRPTSDEIVNEQRFEYNAFGDGIRSEQTFGDERVVTSAEYNMLGHRISTTDALGNVTTTEYDPDGRPVLTDGATYPICTSYDSAGRKASSATTRDDKTTWDVTQWSYDASTGLNIAKTYANGSRIEYGYDDNGRKITVQWARGVSKETAYDNRGLVISNLYSDATTPCVVRTHNDAGKLASSIDSVGTTYEYCYDTQLAVTNERITTANREYNLRKTYDNRKRLNAIQLSHDNQTCSSTTKAYDDEGRLSSLAIINAQGRACFVTYAYDGFDKTNCTISLPSGVRLVRTMARNFNRPEQIQRNAYSFNGHSLFGYEGSYDLSGRLTNAVDSLSIARAYVYNMRSELVSASIGTNDYAYAYDTIGNRITSSRNAAMTQYAANNLNQYSSVNATPFAYDLDGNLITNGTHACEYDAENRLILVASLVVTNGSKRVRNQYDFKHRRIGKVVESYYDGIWQTSESHTFIYDGWNVIAEYISYANGTSKTIEYFWGDDLSNSAQGAGGIGGLLAISINGAYYFPTYDFNGNITAYVSESGNLAAWYAYDGFGNTIDSYGDSSSFSFCFSTKYHDTETGMYYYGHRFYLPHLGRWLNSDPIEEDGGENLYVFCGNNSIVYVDYLGMYRFDSIADFCAGVADSLTMGLTQGVRRAMNRAMFDDWDDFNVDYTSSAYIAGEITETSVEIAVTVGGSVLKKAAAKTLRNSAEYGARRNFRKVNNLVGGEIHHVNPIKGHPGGKLARYPLPFDFAVRGAWNMKWYPSRAAHFAAHKHMEKIEKIDEFRECTLLIRQAGNSIVQMLDSVVGEKCWQSVDISASAENLVSISNGE